MSMNFAIPDWSPAMVRGRNSAGEEKRTGYFAIARSTRLLLEAPRTEKFYEREVGVSARDA
jgi:hypothetical protein